MVRSCGLSSEGTKDEVKQARRAISQNSNNIHFQHTSFLAYSMGMKNVGFGESKLIIQTYVVFVSFVFTMHKFTGWRKKEAVGFNISRCIFRSKCFGTKCESKSWPGEEVADKNREQQVCLSMCGCENKKFKERGAKKEQLTAVSAGVFSVHTRLQ